MIRFKNTNFLNEFSFLVWKHFECCCLTMDQVAYWWLDHWPIRTQHSFTWSTINQSEPGMLMILMMTEKVCWIILSQKLSCCWYNPRLGKTFDQHITITGCESELNDLCLKNKIYQIKRCPLQADFIEAFLVFPGIQLFQMTCLSESCSDQI